MIKVENIEVWGWKHAIRGMRNPMNSWDKSDSKPGCAVGHPEDCNGDCGEWCSGYGLELGSNDLSLMQKLFNGGTEHRKYLRQIFVSLDITAPLYWWKEFDTYKVGTVANSCSTMHKIQAKVFEMQDFSCEHLIGFWETPLRETIEMLNKTREMYLESEQQDKELWYRMIQLLPSSYNQRHTVTMSYENVFTILRQREGHKLDEWRNLCEILKGLPNVKEIGGLT